MHMQPSPIDVRLRDGAQLRLWQWTVGEPTVILLHGLGDCGHIWTDFVSSLDPAARVIAVDLRGHGDSARDPSGNYRLATYVDDVLQVIDLLSLKSAILIGHSLGGEVALHLAAAKIEQIFGIVAIDVSPDRNIEVEAHVRSALAAQHRTYQHVAEFVASQAEIRPRCSSGLLQTIATSSLSECEDGTFTLKTDPATLNSDEQITLPWSLLRSIRCPVLLVRGEWSSVLTANVAERMTQMLRYGRLETVRRVGHDVFVDNPDGFKSIALPYVNNLFATARKAPNTPSR